MKQKKIADLYSLHSTLLHPSFWFHISGTRRGSMLLYIAAPRFKIASIAVLSVVYVGHRTTLLGCVSRPHLDRLVI